MLKFCSSLESHLVSFFITMLYNASLFLAALPGSSMLLLNFADLEEIKREREGPNNIKMMVFNAFNKVSRQKGFFC